MAKNKGICTICGRGSRLSFEHVPPKAAYNETGTELYSLDDWLQRGAGGDIRAMADHNRWHWAVGFMTTSAR